MRIIVNAGKLPAFLFYKKEGKVYCENNSGTGEI